MAFVLALVAGALMITWLKTSVWAQMGRLRQQFSTMPADYFSLDDRVQIAIPRLNGLLLDELVHDKSGAAEFRSESTQLQRWLTNQFGTIRTGAERAAFQKMTQACNEYLNAADELIRNRNQPGAPPLDEVYQTLQKETVRVHTAADQLSRVQNDTFAALLQQSDRTLRRLQKLLQVSVLLLWILALALAVIGYRGMIMPLRNRLDETDALIQRQEKLAALGVLAAGIAHEIRNPLTAIKFRLFSLAKSLPAITHNEDGKVINGEINRLDRIVKQFLQFARPTEPQLVRVPAERIASQINSLMKSPLAKSGIEFQTRVSPGTWLRVDAEQIEQVLLNLIQNSAESIGSKGLVTLQIERGNTELNGQAEPAVILAVTDTGKGIAPEVEKRLFDPFFTTKESGTGLGLTIAARIVEKHGGVLRYRTAWNQGTTFEIVLPDPTHHATEIAAY